jgi:hypothetical protein
MRRSGTLAIVRLIRWPVSAPPYVYLYGHLKAQQRQRREAETPAAVTVLTRWVERMSCCLVVVLLSGVCGVLRLYAQATGAGICAPVLCTAAFGVLVLPGIGTAVIAHSISRPLAFERSQWTWDYLLMLPYPRDEVVFYTVGSRYNPRVSLMALGVTELVVVFSAGLAFPVIGILLVIEWFQLMALSVTVGIISASGWRQNLDVVGPVGLGLATLVVRSGIGRLAATVVGVPGNFRNVALLVGPLFGIISADRWYIGLVIAAIYLLALEVLVRRLLTWSLAHVSEGS